MNDFDDLDQLEREFGPVLRLALRHAAAEIPDDALPQALDVDEGYAFTGSADDLARERHPRQRWTLAAAAMIVVVALGLLTVVRLQNPDSLQTSTMPPTSAPSTNPATTPSEPSVDSSPAPTTAVPTPTAAVPVDEAPATIGTSTAATPSLWVELEPGATAPLPPAPIAAQSSSAMVWTGREVIVWGGEGAAFDPAAGTWRQIAPPPNGIKRDVVLWTGTEMLVWSDGTSGTVSAAYNPDSDTWRLIANPPTPNPPSSMAFWIDDEALVLRNLDDGEGGYLDSSDAPSFAYDPATNEWRRLADGPWGRPPLSVSGEQPRAVWTGTTIITMTDTDSDAGILLNAYDPTSDTWRTLEALDTAKQPVVIPGPGGAATVAFLPLGPETPVELFDDRGNAIGELAGRPAELASTCLKPAEETFCLLTSLRAVSVGGEVLFWYSDDGWAFEPATQTWRSLPLDGRKPGWDGTEVVVAGDLLFAWGPNRDGLVYRANTPG